MSSFKHGGILIETRGGNSHFDIVYMYILQISMRNEWNLKSTNIRATTIIQLVQNMNVKLNINKKSAKAHFKCKSFLNDAKKQHIFAETCLYEAVGSLPVMPSLLPHVLWGEVKSPYFFASVVSPALTCIIMTKFLQSWLYRCCWMNY